MLFTLLCLAPSPVNAQAVPAGIAVGGDNLTRLVWNNSDGSVSLWKIAADGSVATQNSYGPYPGWSAAAVSIGPDSFARVLLNHPADGQMSLWRVDPSSAAFTSANYGPYPGWTALSVGVGGSNAPRVLWNHSSDNLMSLWNVAADTSFTSANYGPFTGYTAFRVAAGPNSIPRTLWKKSDGSVSLWYSTSDMANYAHTEYGPFAGYSLAALAVDSTNAPRIVWNHPSDGTVSLWKVAADGTYTYQNYTDPAGYSPVALAAGTGGDVRLLWSSGQGSALVWTIQSSGAYAQTYPSVSAPAQLTSISISPNNIPSGSTATGTVFLSGPAPANGATVTLSSSNGGVASVIPSVTVPSGATRATFNVTTSGFTSPPSVSVTINANYAGKPASALITVTNNPNQVGGAPPETAATDSFNLGADTNSLTITQGSSGTAHILLTPTNGFSGVVSLSTPNLPVGLSSSFSSSYVYLTGTATQSSVISISSTNTMRPGRYTVFVKGSADSYNGTPVSSSTSFSLTVNPLPSSTPFAVSANTDLVAVAAGSSDTSTISVSSTSGFNQNVSLSISDDVAYPIMGGSTSGATFTFSTASVAVGGSTLLTVAAGGNAPEGVYHLLITARAANGQQTTTPFTLVVCENPDSLSAPPDATPQYPNTPAPYPLATTLSDMEEVDLDGSSKPGSSTQSFPLPGDFQEELYKTQLLVPHVVGKDDRLRVPNNFPYPFCSVCRLVVVPQNGLPWYGSGILIGRNHVLTAAHLVYDQSSGGYVKYIKVYPAYNGGPNKLFQYAFSRAKHIFVPQNYKLNKGHSTFAFGGYDDFAVIDLLPIPDAIAPACGTALGNTASYVPLSDMEYPSTNIDYNTTIAGYPGYLYDINGNKNYTNANAKYMYEDHAGNGSGDKGVYGSPDINSRVKDTNDQLFTEIDTSDGDSGGPFLHPFFSPTGWSVYGVVSDTYGNPGKMVGMPQSGETSGTRITTIRQQIISGIMAKDGDEY